MAPKTFSGVSIQGNELHLSPFESRVWQDQRPFPSSAIRRLPVSRAVDAQDGSFDFRYICRPEMDILNRWKNLFDPVLHKAHLIWAIAGRPADLIGIRGVATISTRISSQNFWHTCFGSSGGVSSRSCASLPRKHRAWHRHLSSGPGIACSHPAGKRRSALCAGCVRGTSKHTRSPLNPHTSVRLDQR